MTPVRRGGARRGRALTSRGLVRRRARAGSGLLLTILALVIATTAIVAGTVGYSRAAATTAARLAVTDAGSATEAGLRVLTRQAEDSQAQDETAQQLISEAFAPAPVQVNRSLTTSPRPVTGRDRRLAVIAGPRLSAESPDLTELIEVVQGSWPAGGPGLTGALHAGAAQEWDVAVGDTLQVTGVPVEVGALWRPVDAGDAAWFGEPLLGSGAGEDLVGPLVVDPSDIDGFGDAPFVRWTILPVAQDLEAQDLSVLAGAAGRLASALGGSEVDVRGVRIEGDLTGTTAQASTNLATARALNVVPLALLLLVSLIAVVQVARLLAVARSAQIEVLIARGASRRQVVVWSMAEAAVVVVAGTALGALLAVAVLQIVPAGPAQTGGVLRLGVLTGGAVLLALTTLTVLQVRGVARRRAADRSGRAVAVTTLGTVVLTFGLALLAWRQLRRYGSPLVTGEDGTLGTDLLAGVAPALLLASAGVLAMVLLGPASRSWELLTRSGRAALAHLSAAQVSRRLVVYAVPVVLTVLAVGASTLSGLYAATSGDLRARLADLGQGAPVRATLAERPAAGESGAAATLPDVGGIAGVDASAPVWLTEGRVGLGEVSTVLAPLDALAQVAIVPPGAADPAALADDLVPARLGGDGADPEAPVAVPGQASSVEVAVDLRVSFNAEGLSLLSGQLEELSGSLVEQGLPEAQARASAVDSVLQAARPEGGLEVQVWLRDPASEVLQQVSAEPLPLDLGLAPPAPGDDTFTATPGLVRQQVGLRLPGDTAYEVVGVDLGLPQTQVGLAVQGELAVLVDGDRRPTPQEVGGWSLRPAGPEGTGASVTGEPLTGAPGGGWRVEVGTGESAGPPVREISLRTGTPAELVVPVAVTSAFAEVTGLSPGSPVDLAVYGSRVRAEVAAVVPAVPGSTVPEVLLADAGVLSRALLLQDRALPDPTELWATGSASGDLAERVAALPGIEAVAGPGSVPVTDAAGAVRLVFWVASAGAVLLAVTGVAAVAATSTAERRPEVAVLRALGMTPGGQARARALELAGVVVVSVLLGLAAGWLVGAAVVPDLARSTTARELASLPVRLRLETGSWALLLAVGAAGVLALLAGLDRRVRAQARDSSYREEIR